MLIVVTLFVKVLQPRVRHWCQVMQSLLQIIPVQKVIQRS
jgi:hypothetical protein